MAGILGIVTGRYGQDAERVFNACLASLHAGRRLPSEFRVACDGRWALGRVHLGVLQPTPQLTKNGPIQVLFQGELANVGELQQSLQDEGLLAPTSEIAPLIAALYQFHGIHLAHQLHGAFCAVILDTVEKKLTLINDLVGSYFLYWTKQAQCFVFASKLKTVLSGLSTKPLLNPQAIADYVNFGFLWGDKTLVEHVWLLPPAATLTYSWEEEKCEINRYARIEDAFQPWDGSHSEYLEELGSAFNRAVKRATQGKHGVGLSLSGGLDSRAILSAISNSEASVSTYTLGVKGAADEVIAQRIARLAGTQHKFYEMNVQYIKEYLTHLEHMVSLTEGMYLSHGLTEVFAMKCLEENDFSILLRGHGGELAKASLAWPLHTDSHIYAMKTKDEFVSYMMRRMNYISRGLSLKELFTDDWWMQIKDAAQASLEKSIIDVSLAPVDLCSYLYLTEHHRRYTIASLELFRSLAEVQLPFVDEDLLYILFRGPAQWRDSTTIHRAIVGANHPALLRVRNSNTGAPGNAGPLLEAVCDKLNSIFKRLNVYGYRHYHAFERWMRQMLIDSTEKVLLEPDSLARGIYQEKTLRRMSAEIRMGRTDLSYLFQILLILELWQREHL